MNKRDSQLDNLVSTETRISENLFSLCSLVTLATMAIFVTDFFSRGSFVSPKMDLFYLAVLLIYSSHKELVRWVGQKKMKRDGEYFVYAWVILTTILYVVNFFTHDYFSFSKEGYAVGTLRDISILTIEVLGVFIFTRILKLIELYFRQKPGSVRNL